MHTYVWGASRIIIGREETREVLNSGWSVGCLMLFTYMRSLMISSSVDDALLWAIYHQVRDEEDGDGCINDGFNICDTIFRQSGELFITR